MVAVYPVLSLLIIFAISLLIVRVGSVALRMTGLTPDVASFQATSAFSGAGFTTEEAEYAISTPERRAVMKALIRLGSIGLVSVIASLVLSFTDSGGGQAGSLVYVLGGVTAIILVARSQWLNRALTPLIERSLQFATDLEVRDYTRILGLQREYRIAEIAVKEERWLANRTPDELDLAAEGVLLLGIQRDGSYIGAPGGDTEIRPDDTVVLYGKEDRLQEIAGRGADDDEAHADAVEAHEETLNDQERRSEQRP